MFGKTAKKAAAKATSKAVSKASEHAGEKAGDKIIELLHKKKTRPVQSIPSVSPTVPSDQPMSDYEINEQVNRIKFLVVGNFVVFDLCKQVL